MPGTPITDYLTKLATDDKAYKDHKKDAKATAKKHGLTDDQADLVASGDLTQIQEALQAENPGKTLKAIVMIASVSPSP